MDKNTKAFRIDGAIPQLFSATEPTEGEVIFVIAPQEPCFLGQTEEERLKGEDPHPTINFNIDMFVCTRNMPQDLLKQVKEYAESTKDKKEGE